MSTSLNVLIVEDHPEDLERILSTLAEAGFDLRWTCVETLTEYTAQLHSELDVILVDPTVPAFDVQQALRLLQDRVLDIVFIVISETILEDVATMLMNQGVSNILPKHRVVELGSVVHETLRKRSSQTVHPGQLPDLKNREELFRLLTAHTSDMLSLHEPEGRFLYVSPACEHLLGYTQAELIGVNPYTLFHPDDLNRIRTESHNKVLDKQIVDSVTYRMRTQTGSYIWLETRTQPVLDVNGNVTQLVATSRDVTERQRFLRRLEVLHRIDQSILRADSMQAMAQATVKLLHELIPFDQVGVVAFDFNSNEMRMLYSQTATGDPQPITGQRLPISAVYQLERLKAQAIIEIEDLHALDKLTPLQRQFITNGIRSYLVVPLVTHDTLIGSFNLGMMEPGAFTQEHISIAQEIGAQLAIGLQQSHLYATISWHAVELEAKVIERTRKLAQLNKHLSSILQSASDAILLINAAGTIRQANPACEMLFGYPETELIGHNILTLIAPEYIRDLLNFLEMTEVRPPVVRLEVKVQSKHGNIFDVVLALAPLIENGDPAQIVCTIHDVTAHKQLEASLRRALEKERDLNQLKSRFVATVSHEYRTPLTVMLSATHMLLNYRDRLDEEKQIRKLQQIEAKIHHMTELLDEILLLARAQSGVLDLNPVPIDLAALCESILDEMNVTLSDNHTLQFEAFARPLPIMADPRLLRQIVTNLVSNAIKYSPAGGTVTVTLERAEDYITLTIADQGIGIPEKDQEHLFSLFHRGTNVERIAGTGLGLMIVKEAVEAHGGTIHFESQEGVGTRFIVRLPTDVKRKQTPGLPQ